MRVCSTPQALRGFRLQGMTIHRSVPVFPVLMLLRRCLPHRVSIFLRAASPSRPNPHTVTRWGPSLRQKLLVDLRRPAPLPGLDRPWSFAPDGQCSATEPGFTRARRNNPPDVCAFRVFPFTTAIPCGTNLRRVSSLSRLAGGDVGISHVGCRPSWRSHLMVRTFASITLVP